MSSEYVDDFKSPWSETFKAMKNVISIFHCQLCKNSESIIQASECCGRYFCRNCLEQECSVCHCKLKAGEDVDLSYPVELCSKLLALLNMQFEIDTLAPRNVETREDLDLKMEESTGMDNDDGDIKNSEANSEMMDVVCASKNTSETSLGGRIDKNNDTSDNHDDDDDDDGHANLVPHSRQNSETSSGYLENNSNFISENPKNTFVDETKKPSQRKRKIKPQEFEKDFLEVDTEDEEDETRMSPKRRKQEEEVSMEIEEIQSALEVVTNPDERSISDSDIKSIADTDKRSIADIDERSITDPDIKSITDPDIKSIAESLLMLEPSILSSRDSVGEEETSKVFATPSRPATFSRDSSAVLTPSSARRGRSSTRNVATRRTSRTTSYTPTLDSFLQSESPKVSDQSATPARRGRRPKNDPVSQSGTPKAADDKKQPMSSKIKKTDLLKRNKKGETALHIACIKGNIEQVRQCLDEGLEPNLRDNANWTPLHEACNKGFHEIAELLLVRGADANALGMNNCTPLHDSATNERMECVKVLLGRGANVNVRNDQGLMAENCTENPEILELFKKYSEMTSDVGPSTERETKQLLKFTQPERIIITTTGLDKVKKSWLVAAIDKLGWTLEDNINEEVTHVISSTNENKVCQRTLKYMLAIVTSKWIVTMDWLKACEANGGWLREEEFIVRGCSSRPESSAPRRSKLLAQAQVPGIFKGCNFFISPSITSNTARSELSTLIKFGSGEILLREPKISDVDVQMMDINHNSASLCSSTPFHAPSNSPFASCSFFIVQDSLPEKASYKMANKKLCRVTTTWLYDCISSLAIIQ